MLQWPMVVIKWIFLYSSLHRNNTNQEVSHLNICKEFLLLTLAHRFLVWTGFRCLILPRRRWPGQPHEPPRKGCLLNSRYIVIVFVMLLTVVPAYAVGDKRCWGLSTKDAGCSETIFYWRSFVGNSTGRVSKTNWSLCSN